jgi:hypothetical protein
MIMLDVLSEAEQQLPQLVKSLDGWRSLFVNYHAPFVERLWRPFGTEHRLFLHCIHRCSVKEALLHPHPWPSAIRVLEGLYGSLIGAGSGTETPPVVYQTVVQASPQTAYRYAMLHPDGWHAVIPLTGYVYSVMVTGKPWNRPIPSVTQEAVGSLRELSPERAEELLAVFREFYP